MSLASRCALLAILTLPINWRSLAQSAASSAASSSAVPSAATTKPVAAKKPEAKPDKKYFIEVYPLGSSDLKFGPGSCFSNTLRFPATNATEVAKLLTSDSGFILTAIPPSRIAIYYKTASPPAADLARLRDQMKSLANSDFTNATAVRVPTGSAEKSVAQLRLPPDGGIAVKAVGANCILVVSKNQADPVTLAALTSNISQLYWQQPSTPPTQRLFYNDAMAVAKKLSASGDSGADTSGSGTGKVASAKPKGSSSSSGESATASSTVSPTVSVSVAPGSAPASAKATSGANGPDSPAASEQTGAADGTSEDTAKAASVDKTYSKTAPAPPPKPPTMQPVNDMLVYSNEDGSDRGIFERHRLMAVLDLPRPEVLMNIWSLQASSKNYKAVIAEAEAAHGLVAHHNDLLQRAIDMGWTSLSRQMMNRDFFDDLFYRYVTQKFGETDFELERVALQSEAEPFVNESGKNARNSTDGDDSRLPSSKPHSRQESEVERTVDSNRERWGWCHSHQYCLGFSRAFEPLRPTFTNVLIGMIAAREPSTTAKETIDKMEGPQSDSTGEAACQPQPLGDKDSCADHNIVDQFRSCMANVNRQLHTFEKESSSCELDDRIALSEQILNAHEERLQLNCFRKQAQESFGPDTPGNSPNTTAANAAQYATTRAGLLRAAVADFLFNYKWATQYPHDFIPYDLTQSAQELNAEFNPLVLAFNRDVSAFTENLQAELQCKYESDISRLESRNWFKNDEGTFINDGMLSVRGISGVESIADTVTQSFFDATNPPSLTDLVKSVSDAEKNIPGVLQTNLTANEAAVLLGALNSVQPAEAKLGRELKLDITPHALAGASSAELEVKLTAEEVGNPTRFTADKSAEDTLSRIAKHDVSTRVRVESTKLFEVSAFSAMLQRPRSKFPILPPLFEVPYFGSFIGWPLRGAQVYHRSTAIVSAVIVPTAADLAFGIDFGADRFCDEDGCHHAISPRDFGSLPLRNFHKAMIACLASGEKTAYTGLNTGRRSPTDIALDRNACGNLALFERKAAPERVLLPAAVPIVPPND
jgi:hypothetical protein